MAQNSSISNLVVQFTFALIGFLAFISLDGKLRRCFPKIFKNWDALPASSQKGWRHLWAVVIGTSIFFIIIAGVEQAVKPEVKQAVKPEEYCPFNYSILGLYCLIVKSELLKLAETFSIVAATWIFILDRRERREHMHREDWSLIDRAKSSETSGARYSAIESLHQERVSLRGLDAEGADLHGINLPGAILKQSNLQKADLQNSNLARVNLQEANLQESNLERSNLEGADLWLVDLRGANLKEANLKNSRLSAAKLQRAIVRKADLEGADLRGTRFYSTDFRDANLKDANIKYAEFAKVKNLTLEQIKSAKNWQDAKFAKDVFPESSGLPRKDLSSPSKQPELLRKLDELREIEDLIDEINQKRNLSSLDFERYLKNNSFEIPEVETLGDLILALEDLQELKEKEFEDLLEDTRRGLSGLKQSEDHQ